MFVKRLTVEQLISESDVDEFVEFINQFDDETYVNDCYETIDFDFIDDDEDNEVVIVEEVVDYRSDKVGYLGMLVTIKIDGVHKSTKWIPHETLEFRYRYPINL